MDKKIGPFHNSLINRKLLKLHVSPPLGNRHLNQDVIEVNNYIILSSVYVVLKFLRKSHVKSK